MERPHSRFSASAHTSARAAASVTDYGNRRGLGRAVVRTFAAAAVAIVLLWVTATGLQTTGFFPEPNATCAPYGDQPNPSGSTTVDENTLWCGIGLRAGGTVYVGSTAGAIEFRLQDGSVDLLGDMIVGDGSAKRPVTMVVSNFVISLSVAASEVLIERVPNGVASTGSVIRITGSTIQGTISDPNIFPLGLKIKSGPSSSYRLHTVQIEYTTFRNLGNYWQQNQAALDTYLGGDKSASSSWSKFAPGSYFRRLNVTNPPRMQGSPPQDDPFGVHIGDSLPIQNSAFYGGFMAVGYSKWVWDSTFDSVCRDTYDPMPGGLIQNNTYIQGNQGGGCKDIDFFRGGIRFRNNTLTFVPGSTNNFANQDTADNNIVEGNTFRDASASCAGGYSADRLRISNNTFNGGGVIPGLLLARCLRQNVTNNVVANPTNVGIAVINYPGETATYFDAAVYYNTVSGCGESESNSYVCYHMRQQTNAVVSGLNITATSAGWATEIDKVTNTLFKNLRITNAKVGLRVLASSGLTFDSVRFSSISAREYYFSSSTDITIRNPILDTASIRIESVGTATALKFRWTTLTALAEYGLTRSSTAGTETFVFTTDSLGVGILDLANPTGAVYTYSLVLRVGTDVVAPARVSDLGASRAGDGTVTLAWTAPGDDGPVGSASGYQLRYSTTGAITDANWYDATVYAQSWIPKSAGGSETYALSGMDPAADYWYALRASDEVFNWGSVSNSPFAARTVTEPTIQSLDVSATGSTVDADGQLRFTATARYTDGSSASVTPAWMAENGTVRSDGTFTPWSIGSWDVCALYASLTTCATVGVTPGALAAVFAAPAILQLAIGATADLSVSTYDAKGNPVSGTLLEWSVEPAPLGSVTNGTRFQAASSGEGILRLNATDGRATRSTLVELIILPAGGGPGGDPPIPIDSDPEGSMAIAALSYALFALVGVMFVGSLFGSVTSLQAIRRAAEIDRLVTVTRRVRACYICGARLPARSLRCWRCGSPTVA